MTQEMYYGLRAIGYAHWAALAVVANFIMSGEKERVVMRGPHGAKVILKISE